MQPPDEVVDPRGVRLRREGAVAVLTLDRPTKLNALDAGATQALVELLDALARDREVRAVVLTGAGRGFCSGADTTTLAEQGTAPVRGWRPPLGHDLLPGLIQDHPKVFVAAINGVAAGAGASLALACDLRVASSAGSFAFVHLARGLNPDYGLSYLLARGVGPQRALALLVAGERVGADEARELGLVLEVVPPEELLDRALAWGERLAAQPPLALALAKQSIHRAMTASLAETAALEAWGNVQTGASDDFREAMAALAEGRPPRFRGS